MRACARSASAQESGRVCGAPPLTCTPLSPVRRSVDAAAASQQKTPTRINVAVGGADVEANASDGLPQYDDESAARRLRDRRMLGAAGAASVLVLLLSWSLLLALAAGAGAAFVTTMEGQAGDVARRVADKVLELVEWLHAFLHEHMIPERAAAAASAAAARASEFLGARTDGGVSAAPLHGNLPGSLRSEDAGHAQAR